MVSQGRLQGLPKEESGAKKIICSKYSSGNGETLFENTEQQDSSNDNQFINSISRLENERPYNEEDCHVTSQAQRIPEQNCEPLYVRTKTGQDNRGHDYDDDKSKLMNHSRELGAGHSIIVDLEEAAINSFEYSKDQDFHNEMTNHDLQDLKNKTNNTTQSQIDFPHEDTLTKDNCSRIHDEHSPPSMQESIPEDNCFYMTSEGSPLQDSHESHPEIPCSSQTVSSRNIVYRSVSAEDPTVVSNSLQTARKVQRLTLGSESQLLLSDVPTIPEQLPLILTEGDAEEHESLTLARTEQLQAVSTQTVLGTSQRSAGLMVFSSTDMIPISSAHLIPISGTNLLVLQGIDGQGQLIQPNSVIITGQPQILPKDIEQVSQGKVYGKQYHCPHVGCPKVAPTSSKLKLHMLSHTGERPYKCPLEDCDWAFTTAYKLKRHIRGHTGERPFICEVGGCDKRFTTTYNLKTHQKAHVREQDNICSFQDCQLSFSSLHKLKAHEKKHLLENELHTCNFVSCGKQFKSLSNYNAHLKNHSGERPHACTFDGCGKRFTKASKLKLHVRTHTGERPFVCEMENCDWSFTSAYKLKRHMRKHTGERPFTCEFTGCGRSFTRASHMRTHALSHTGQKPYICPLTDCLKGFTAASSLTIHMRKHSGDKPFKCGAQGCDKAYTTAANLRLHQKRHENKNPHLHDSIVKDEHLAPDHPRPMHYVEIGGVNSVVETDPSSAPATPYSVMHSFSGEDFASEDVASLTVVQFSPEETFPPQTPVSTMDSAGSICFQFSSSDSYAHPPHSSASSSISGLSFTASGTPLPSPGAQYTQTSMVGVEVETAEDLRTSTDGQLCSHDSPPGETTQVNTAGYIVQEQTVCTDGTLTSTEKEDEDLTLPTMVVFTSPSVQPDEDSSPIPPSNDLEGRRSEEHGNSERNILTLQQPCESSAIEEFAPPEIIFQGEDVKGHVDTNLKDTERSALTNHGRVQPSRPSNLSGLPVSNISLNLSSLSDDIHKSPVCPFIDHESTINLQDLR